MSRYKLVSAFSQLNGTYTGRISRILPFDDMKASSAWKLFDRFVDIPVEHKLVKRVKPSKSMVDMTLALGVSDEFYKNNVDSFLLVASDVDYYSLVSNLPEARFLIMAEESKCSRALKDALYDAGLPLCVLDGFAIDAGRSLMEAALLAGMEKALGEALSLNVRATLDKVIKDARVTLDSEAKERFYQHCEKCIELRVDKDGNAGLGIYPQPFSEKTSSMPQLLQGQGDRSMISQ